jgi:ElaB/YqjD/DUF883 family membrane-anchored ribosome-binding protein
MNGRDNNHDTRHSFEEARGEARSRLERAGAATDEKIMRAKRSLEDSARRMEDYTRRHPEKAMLISVGVGTIIGLILSAIMTGKSRRRW